MMDPEKSAISAETITAAITTVSLADIADMAGVGLSAVSNWRDRYPAKDAKTGELLADAFPTPVTAPDAVSPLFDITEIEKWLSERGKTFRALTEVREVLPFESQLWKAADALRGNMDAAEYKHVVLGLLFLKYISDAFEEQASKLAVVEHADLEDPDEYRAEGVFWVPSDARWSTLQESAKTPEIGVIVDKAMAAVERDNASLKGVLPRDYARPGLDKTRLGQLVDMVSNITVGDRVSRSQDVLGRTYEYFLSQFASAEGKKGGEFYTPQSVVKLLVEMLAPYHGRVYDPCCGSGGMFVQSERFVEEHGGRLGDVSIFGQESNYTTWRLAKMNLAIRGIEANIQHGDTLLDDKHPDLKADFILANPPFNDSDWGGDLLKDDRRWQYGTPPKGNANFAWVQHFISHLSPRGTAGFVLSNGSMSSAQSGEGEIRRRIVEADLVDCMVALPGQLFYSTAIPVCLWFLARDKHAGGMRDRRGEVLFIDARDLGTMTDRTHRELSTADIDRIASTYHAWRSTSESAGYVDVSGFCKSVGIDEIREHRHVLSPGRYVGAAEMPDDGEPTDDKLARLSGSLAKQFEQASLLDAQIRESLGGIGFEF